MNQWRHFIAFYYQSIHAIIRLTDVTQVSLTGTPGHILVNRYTRIQPMVFVNGVESNFYLLKSGVLQGSISGPFLFIVYINDMVRATYYFTVRLFADDTSLTAVGSDLDVLIQRISSKLPPVYEWLCSNKLTLNLSRTKYLVFQPRQRNNYNLYPPLN